jgi:hypothetical protein
MGKTASTEITVDGYHWRVTVNPDGPHDMARVTVGQLMGGHVCSVIHGDWDGEGIINCSAGFDENTYNALCHVCSGLQSELD